MPDPIRLSALVAASIGASLGLGACDSPDVDDVEMRAAIDEAVASGEAQHAEIDLLDLTTDLDPGGEHPKGDSPLRGLLEGPRLRDHMRGLIASQLPCSTLEDLDDDTLQITLGSSERPCTFRGAEWSGVIVVSYQADDDIVTIEHEYLAVTNGKVQLDGTSVVERTDAQRHVVNDFTFQGPRGTFHSSSDRIHTPMADGLGMHIEGTRDVERPRGLAHIDIVDVEVARGDVVPQDGSYVLTTPEGREMTMTFARLDADTILVTVTGGKHDREFEVDAGGRIRDRRRR